MKNIIIAFTLMLSLTGCGTMKYNPNLAKEEVLSKNILVNIQDNDEEKIVYSYMGFKLASTLKEITETITSSVAKTTAVSRHESYQVEVTDLKCIYNPFPVRFNCSLELDASKINAEPIKKAYSYMSVLHPQDCFDKVISMAIVDLAALNE